jgi:integral membrane protein
MNMTKWLRLFGRLEGFSFLILLFVCVPLKHFSGWPMGVRAIGPVHGALFLVYCAVVYMNAAQQQWPAKQQALAYLAAVMPFGTFWFERKYLRTVNSAS